jgi:hypothetical protein
LLRLAYTIATAARTVVKVTHGSAPTAESEISALREFELIRILVESLLNSTSGSVKFLNTPAKSEVSALRQPGG